jgi:hypothetical protein
VMKGLEERGELEEVLKRRPRGWVMGERKEGVLGKVEKLVEQAGRVLRDEL